MLFYAEKNKMNRPALNLLFDHIIIQDSIFKLSWHNRRCKNKESAAIYSTLSHPFNKTDMQRILPIKI